MKVEPLKQKFKSFDCNVSIVNGHNVNEILKSLKTKKNNKPNVIIANTIKGKGISFMENKIIWHYRSPNKDEFMKGLDELK